MHYQKTSELKPADSLILTPSIHSFLRYFKKRVYFYLGLFITTAFSFYFIYQHQQYYESKIELTLNSAQANGALNESHDAIKYTLQQSTSLKRIFQIVYSSEMQDKLIEKFNFIAIYDLSKNENKISDCYDMLQKNITITINPFDVISIIYKDKTNSQRAADVANFIAAEALVLNRSWYVSQLIQRISVDSLIYSKISIQLDNEKKFFESNLLSLNKLISQTNSLDKFRIAELTQSLQRNEGSISNTLDKYIEITNHNVAVLSTLNDKYFTEMLILKKAIPENKKQQVPFLVMIPLLILWSLILSFILFYAFYQISLFVKSIKTNFY